MKFALKFSANLAFVLWRALPISKSVLVSTILLVVAPSLCVFAQQPQTRGVDHLTTAEDNLIHETQELDKRIEIFVKAIDRRLLVINGTTTETKTEIKVNKEVKKKEKEAEKLGELPIGTRTELFGDIKSILDEAVRNIDNAAEHNAKNALLPKALKTLAAGCSRFVPQFKSFYDSAQSETDRAAAYDARQTCQEIVESNVKHDSDATK